MLMFMHNSLVFDSCGSRDSFMLILLAQLEEKGYVQEQWKSTHYHFLDESRLIRNLFCRKIRCCCRHCFLSSSFLAAGLLRQKVSFVGLPSGKILPLVSEIFSM